MQERTIQLENICISMASVMQQADEGSVMADCPEGCFVKPDGVCPHGHESALIKLGLI